MFIKNPSSIKRKTILLNDADKNKISAYGYQPVAKGDDGWVFILTEDIQDLLYKIRDGGEKKNER